MIPVFSFVLLCLATFRLTRLVLYDKITAFIRTPFIEVEEQTLADGSIEETIYVREKGWKRWVGELLTCHWCFGMWMSLLLLAGFYYVPVIFLPIILVLAIAAVASIIEVMVGYFL
ncbi:putative sporulation protein [Gracilibacillus halophilus YIM-C55.5]|uniref:Putative sporulation protein n=1 Tax=Gracilibacillus halophilus YIM-C55.5 TaxID=1308866 RepID=N4W864_9BACI|nr:DUF1360 domain-containing protein [Gracilibacillus halophilus]ENH96463.1 putative sporulation protein [Gracilibacillus halophilus YIM-C55.5]